MSESANDPNGPDRRWIRALSEAETSSATADSIIATVAASALAEAERSAVSVEAAIRACPVSLPEAAAAAGRAVTATREATAAVLAAAAEAATASRRVEAQLTHDLLHDGLTGLANRRLLVDRLTQALARGKRAGRSVVVLFLDLDSFKAVNDSRGHGIGDQLLISVARRLEECLRGTDTCARVGGDEFVVVCEDLDDPSVGSIVARRLMAALAAGVPLGAETVPVRVSIGLAVGSADSLPGELLNEADDAMYRAKGHNGTHVRRTDRPVGRTAARVPGSGPS